MAPSMETMADQRPSKERLSQAEEEKKQDEIGYDLVKCEAASKLGTDPNYKREVVWKNAIGMLVLHLAGLYGLYVGFVYGKFWSGIWMFTLAIISGFGITAGAHRLYTHRAYKAGKFVRIMLLIFQTMSGQNCMYIWVRDHRLHHKFTDTDADPHNSNRGLFFSHVGWLMSRKHPYVKEYGKKIDMSDLEADPYVMFQKKYYKTIYFIVTVIIPTAVPVLVWNETLWMSFIHTFIGRYVLSLNSTWCVNSVAHVFGTRPFDKSINPTESRFTSFIALGEGWHNYHHVFPWDYRTSEFGAAFNVTTRFIDGLAKLGLVYDRKCAPISLIELRSRRTGDGTHDKFGKTTETDDQKEPTNEAKPVDSSDECKIVNNNSNSCNNNIDIGKVHITNGFAKKRLVSAVN